jgi:hypothetical protein
MAETSNQIKTRLLGEPYGTATGRLRKVLMFEMAKRLDEDICYRCKYKIESVDEFSIEHTVSWQGASNPKEVFFDTSKIGFSHLICNIRHGNRHRLPEEIRIERARLRAERQLKNRSESNYNITRRESYAIGNNPNRRARKFDRDVV